MLVGYARVSTKDQFLELQIDALQQAGCVRIYQEKMSGRRHDRPVLRTAIESLQPGDTLVVWKLSRLGRSLKQLVEVLSRLAERDIVLKSLHEVVDISTATGKLLFHIFAAVAEFEAENAAENTRAGIAARRDRGLAWGRHHALDDHARARALALLASEPRRSVRQVCQELHVSKSTLYRTLGKAALGGIAI